MEDRYLFRAKRVDNGEWVIGYYVHTLDGDYIVEPTKQTLFSEGTIVDIMISTLCQCTGLEDKNDKLIWENDILRGKMHVNYGYRKLTGVVQYYIDAFKVNVEPHSFSGDYKNISNTCEVIGNIFDNPELLGSEE